MANEVGGKRYDIVPTSLAVTAMRDNGYKNAAYALAELMDNSIQAGANTVELLCADKDEVIDQRTRRRLREIAVLDNGTGMDIETLQIALQFGNGTRLGEGNAKGMGRFGMGLPSASISQCRRVDVWTWQAGIASALHSYIDLDEIAEGRLDTIPRPEASTVPSMWLKAAQPSTIGQTGTLVVWSNIDKVLWRTSKSLIDNSEDLIGRMYREWLSAGSIEIRLKSFLLPKPGEHTENRTARPNDPLYLMSGTTCPAPFNDKPMFEPFPSEEGYEVKTTVSFRGQQHLVVTRFSLASAEARSGDNAGSLPAGRHAAKNVGVSVVRAGRELELDPAWTTSYDPRERWWGVEVRFDPGLDELFGVSNNKQSARNFAEAAKIDTAAIIKANGGSISSARDALKDDEDPLEPLLELVHRIQTNIVQMRSTIKVQSEGKRRKRHREDSVEDRATEKARARRKQGNLGASDTQEDAPLEDRRRDIAEQLEQNGHSPKEATSMAAETIDKGLKYKVEVASIEGGAFFSVQPRGGIVLVTLNTDHPAYGLLLGASDPTSLPNDPEELKERLLASQQGLEMLLLAWARYEDEQASDPERRRATQNARHDWGRMAEFFLAPTSS